MEDEDTHTHTHTLDVAFMADGLTLMVFMIQMSLEFAKTKTEPQAWVTGFINNLYERIDANELGVGMEHRIHTIARERVDLLGATLRNMLTHRP
jgi:hypothetical protein